MKIEEIRNQFDAAIKDCNDLGKLNDMRIQYLGKKGLVQELMQEMRNLSNEEKPKFGQEVNVLKQTIIKKINEKNELLTKAAVNEKLMKEKIDVTLPGYEKNVGTLHPIYKTIRNVEKLFTRMGYTVAEGPEVEADKYNFEMLNLPKDHPARDMQDSFYITEEYLLRSQTSPVQVRTMLKNEDKGPIKIICPGKVYRRDDDATHSHQFTQIEALVVDEGISMADLKGTLEVVARHLFGEEREIRLRPSFFPFTEPSVEVDVSCFKCNGKGCNLCKSTGWIEILGAGMVHPNVLKMAGYDPEKYQGFALGMGIERIAMLKYGIDDIRHFYVNDVRFLSQFKKEEI